MCLTVQIDSCDFTAIASAARQLVDGLGLSIGRRQVEVRVADDTFLFPSISSAARWIGEFVQFTGADGRPLAVPQSVRRAFVAALAAQFAAGGGVVAAQPAVPKAPPSLEQSVVALLDALDDAIDLPADLTPDDVVHLVPRALPRLRGRPDLIARKLLLLAAATDDLHPSLRASRLGKDGFRVERKEV